MFSHRPNSRWQAFGIHLLISLCLFITMCLIIVVLWYPGLLFTTEGGWQGVRLIASIDFVIGPILTLIVYQKGKKGLKFDLAVIGTLQAVCITYGMYVVHYSRPAVVAYADGNFYTTPLLRFDSRRIDISQVDLLKQRYPVWVNVQLPADKQERLNVKIAYVRKGLETAVDRYEPYEKAIPLLSQEGFSLLEAKQSGLAIDDSLDTDHIRVFKLFTRYRTHAVAVDIHSGQMIKLLGTIRPDTIGLVPFP